MRIGVDIDDCLCAWSQWAHAACLEAGITNGATITRWHFEEDYGVTREQLWEVLFDAYRRGMLLQPPLEGVQAVLSALRDEYGHSVHLVTARGSEGVLGPLVRSHTVAWVEQYGIPHDSLTFTPDKSIMHLDAFIDDAERNLQAVHLAGCKRAWLMDQPHNQASPWRRVSSLDEFASKLEPNWVSPLAKPSAA